MIPVTYMFGEVLSTDGTIFPPDPDRLAQFKALIFWVLWIETSGAEYEEVGTDPNFPEVNTAFLRNVPYCMGATAGENFSFDQNGVQGEQSTAFSDPQILFVHHCDPNTGTSSSPFDREFVYLYSFGILNGMLGYERNNALSDPDRFDYWVLEAGNFRYMKAESRDGFGFVESLCGYYPGPAGALEYHVELLNCITQLQPDNQPTNMHKRDVRKAKLAYENYYQYISAAVDDFAQLAQNPDSTFYPIGGSVFLRHVNDGTLDGSAGLVLPVGGRCEEGYCISDPSNVNQQLILDIHQEFILLIRASARASTETVYRPSLRIEYDDDVHEILRGFQWTAWAYSLPVNDLGLPR
ncbi:MAG: hypothetical protein KJ064_16815 [Anaerolineae bacterium]|nr:hypothetical protein [Anaerolineae bacterium]